VPPPSKLLTVKQVIELLAVSRPTLYRLVRDRELQLLKIGTATRFRAHDVDMLVERLAGVDPRNGPSDAHRPGGGRGDADTSDEDARHATERA
jgi:excisionase family DNA binding protein